MTNRVAAERLSDRASAVFNADYVHEQITHGYASTVHSAQGGVTADTTHAVLGGESTTRSMLYVAMTRARDANTAYLYERITEQEYGPLPVDSPHVMQRGGTSAQASLLASSIIEAHDDVPVTAHQVAAATPGGHLLPDMVARLVDRQSAKVEDRNTAHTRWQNAIDGWDETMERAHEREQARATNRSRDHSRDSGFEL